MDRRPPPEGWRQSEPPPETEPPPQGWAECSGAFIPADHIQFSETVWRNGKKIGGRQVTAEVVQVDGAGEDDWVYLTVIACEGDQVSEVLEAVDVRRKRRTIEREGVLRRLWDDEDARTTLVDGG